MCNFLKSASRAGASVGYAPAGVSAVSVARPHLHSRWTHQLRIEKLSSFILSSIPP